MKRIKIIVRYFLAFLFFLLGMAFLLEINKAGSILFFAAGILISPLGYKFFKSKFGLNFKKSLIIITVFLISVLFFISPDNKETEKSNLEEEPKHSETTVQMRQNNTLQNNTIFDVKEFINKDSKYFLKKLGEPIGGEKYNNPPMSTLWSWDEDSYKIEIDFEKGRPVKYISVLFKGAPCDQKTDRYLKPLGLKYPQSEPLFKRDGHLYRWEPYNGKYERLNIYCDETGVTVVLISEIFKP